MYYLSSTGHFSIRKQTVDSGQMKVFAVVPTGTKALGRHLFEATFCNQDPVIRFSDQERAFEKDHQHQCDQMVK